MSPTGGGSLDDVLASAALTLREAVRRRLAWALLLLTALVVVVTAWGFERFVQLARQDGVPELQLQLGVSQLLIMVAFMFSFVLAMVAVVFGSPAVAGDVESGVALAVLARPIRRSAYVAGRWLGLVVVVVTYAVLSGAAEEAVCAWVTGWVPPHPVEAVAYLAGEGVVLLTFALALSTRLSMITGGAIAVVLFGLAWVVGLLGRFAVLFGVDALQQAAAVSQRLLPSDTFWIGATASLEPASSQLAQAGFAGSIAAGRFGPFYVAAPPDPLELGWAVGWIALVLVAAVLLFERREL